MRASSARLFWCLPLIFACHIAEELPRFPAWATRHFGVTTPGFFVLSHVFLVVAVVGVAVLGARSEKGGTGVLLCAAALFTMATNGIFHVVTTALFREYSPGVVTSVAVYLPFSIYFCRRVLASGDLDGRGLGIAAALGTAASAAVVASLFLDLDFV